MKLTLKTMFITLLSLSLLAGCGQAQDLSSGSVDASQSHQSLQEQSEEKLSVYASFYPMYDFASKIGGNKVSVVNLVPSGIEPHDWEPSAVDITGLEEAEVFVYSGAGMEHWVGDVLASLQNKGLIAVEASAGIQLIEGQHSHDHEDEEGHDHDHEDEEGHDHDHDDGEYDPHVWLDPMKAKMQAEAIKDAFVQADPGNRDYYEANFLEYSAAFDALDKEFRDSLSATQNKDIIVSHEAFGYLCAAYGLNQIGIDGLSPDSEPSPARMAEVIDFAKKNAVKVIFFEGTASPKVAQTIADATGAKIGVLSPIETLSDGQRANGDDYFAVMRQNLESLKLALQ